MVYYCDTRKFNATQIEWVNDEANESTFPTYADLPKEVYDWPVRGYQHWPDIEWEAACILQISDAYGWRIHSAKVKRCEDK